MAAPPPSQITLTGTSKPTRGSFRFTFTNTPGAFFGVVATTNLALPLSNWAAIIGVTGGVTEISPGQFQFTDPRAGTAPQRFYRVRSP